MIANPSFGFQVSESGSGYTWSGNSRENQLTPWSNDPVSDPVSEAIYLRDDDSGQLWSPTARFLANLTPVERAAMVHWWDELTFVHWRYDADVIQGFGRKGARLQSINGRVLKNVPNGLLQQLAEGAKKNCPLSKALAAVPASHAAQHAVGGVLQRHVHVRQDARVACQELDQLEGGESWFAEATPIVLTSIRRAA